jgi:tetratricopeptide (TPR) repeat protein
MAGFLPVTLACFSRPNLGFIIEPHWLTYASVGFFLLVSLFLLWMKKHIIKTLWILIVIALIAANISRSRHYNYLWGSEKRYCRYWLTLMPYNFMPNFWLGYSLMEEKNYAEAKKHYELLLNKVNKAPEAYGNFGIIEYHLGNYNAALSHFKDSLAADKNNADTHYYMGDIYLKQGDLKNAQMSFGKCLELDPRFSAAKEKLDHILKKL